ncbi:hypothetical protein NQZ68_007521 [Dissostichus eleginoides]|nr:hypothetical protein NQZ68_007521 [Dissostichus eleginoides]
MSSGDSSGDAPELNPRVSVLSWDQVRRLDSILGESIPIHGRGNFPTLSVQPRHIVQPTQQTELSVPERLLLSQTGGKVFILHGWLQDLI